MTVGGDGTFLSTSHFIDSSHPLILGINSDIKNSVGHLCSYELDFENLQMKF